MAGIANGKHDKGQGGRSLPAPWFCQRKLNAYAAARDVSATTRYPCGNGFTRSRGMGLPCSCDAGSAYSRGKVDDIVDHNLIDVGLLLWSVFPAHDHHSGDHAEQLLGGVINITPILTVKDGEAATAAKTRSQKKAMAKIVKLFEEDIAAYGLKNLVVHYIGSKIPAEKWAEEVINPLVGFKARVVPASPVIGVHVGPAVGIAYECKQRIEGKFTAATPEVVM